MSKARIWMEVRCGCCGCMSSESRFYNNSKDVRNLKESVKDWEYTSDYGNTCPDCLEEIRKGK